MPIDRAVRSAWARAVNLALPRPGPDALPAARRVLFLRHDAIGDMLSSLGAIRALARHGLEVDVLASPANATVLDGNTWGVRVLVAASGRGARGALSREMSARRYDVVIDGLALKPSVNTRTVRFLRLSRAPVRIGTLGRAHDFLYTHGVATDLTANHVEVLAALLAPFGIGAEAALEPVGMPLAADELARAEQWWAAGATTRLFVNLSASSPERRWHDDRFIAVLRAFAEGRPGADIAISASPAEWDAAGAVAAATGARPVRGSVREAFALLSRATLVLTPDTSVAHAAAGFQVPSVVMMPRGNLRFAPWRAPGRLVVSPAGDLGAVGVEEVVAAMAALVTG